MGIRARRDQRRFAAARFLGRPGRAAEWVALGFLMAFGAGALLAALAIELVAPSVQALHEKQIGHAPAGSAVRAFLAMGAGMAVGSALFIALDQIVNAQGGFLRKSAATAAWLAHRKQHRHTLVLNDLGRMEALQSLPPEAIGRLVDMVRPVDFRRGDILFRQGDPSRAIYFVRSGEVQLFQGGVPLLRIGPEGVLGEWSLMAGKPRADTAEAVGDVHCLMLRKGDFNVRRGKALSSGGCEPRATAVDMPTTGLCRVCSPRL